LVLEKTLKAIFVQTNENKVPPKTHNLETRYPDYKHEFYNSCTKEYTDKYLIEIKEYYKWFKSQIK
jgi:hypothetical protein